MISIYCVCVAKFEIEYRHPQFPESSALIRLLGVKCFEQMSQVSNTIKTVLLPAADLCGKRLSR